MVLVRPRDESIARRGIESQAGTATKASIWSSLVEREAKYKTINPEPEDSIWGGGYKSERFSELLSHLRYGPGRRDDEFSLGHAECALSIGQPSGDAHCAAGFTVQCKGTSYERTGWT